MSTKVSLSTYKFKTRQLQKVGNHTDNDHHNHKAETVIFCSGQCATKSRIHVRYYNRVCPCLHPVSTCPRTCSLRVATWVIAQSHANSDKTHKTFGDLIFCTSQTMWRQGACNILLRSFFLSSSSQHLRCCMAHDVPFLPREAMSSSCISCARTEPCANKCFEGRCLTAAVSVFRGEVFRIRDSATLDTVWSRRLRRGRSSSSAGEAAST